VPDIADARAWQTAAVCLRVMAVSNALLLGYVHLLFAVAHPDYYSQAWPSFSRALSDADLTIYRWIAAAAAACQVIGCAAVASLHQRQARGSPTAGAFFALTIAWSLASALGIVHYLHMTIVVDSAAHMVLSYVFFFGMSLFVVADAFASARTGVGDAPAGPRRAAHGVALAIVASGLTFLVTYFLKDAGWNPLPTPTQKVFVAAEVAWVILCHVYVLLCLKRLQRPLVDERRFRGMHVDMSAVTGREPAAQAERSR
jgi:hypothetical protein